MKQNGAVLAKGWLLGLQFAALLENGEYFAITKRADELAMQIKKAFPTRIFLCGLTAIPTSSSSS